MSPLQMTPDLQSCRFVYMSACEHGLDLQGTEAKWSPRWCPRLAELCCTGMVMHALNMNLHLSKQVSSTFCGVMFALLIVNILQLCKTTLACCVRFLVGQPGSSTLRLHVNFASRCIGGNGMAIVASGLGLHVHCMFMASRQAYWSCHKIMYEFNLMQKVGVLC